MVNSEKPVVSVIVPSFNHARYLRQRLDSIFEQTFRDFEVILLDDGSTDQSIEILKEYAVRDQVSHLIINKTNSGSAFKQWKKGIEIARGEWIWIAESDDACELDFLEEMMASVATYPHAVIHASNLKYLNAENKLLDYYTHYTTIEWEGTAVIKKHFLYGNYIGNASSVIIRKKTIEFIEWNPIVNMHFCGDWFFYVMMLMHGNLVTRAEYLSYFRVHDQTVSKDDRALSWHFTEGLEVAEYILHKCKTGPLKRYFALFEWISRLKRSKLENSLHTGIKRKMREVFRSSVMIAEMHYTILNILRKIKYKLRICLFHLYKTKKI